MKKSIEPKLNIITNKINKTDNNNTKYPQLDNKLYCTIENIGVQNCNYELRPLVSINCTDNIDWKCNPLKPSDDQLNEWNSSVDTFIALKNSNDSNIKNK